MYIFKDIMYKPFLSTINLYPFRDIYSRCISTIHPRMWSNHPVHIVIQESSPPTKRTVSYNQVATISHQKHIPATIGTSIFSNKPDLSPTQKRNNILLTPINIITKYIETMLISITHYSCYSFFIIF